MIASILFDRPTVLSMRDNYTKYLHGHKIDLRIDFIHEGTYIVAAFKRIGNEVKHMEITGIDLLECLARLVKAIEEEIEEWIEQELY